MIGGPWKILDIPPTPDALAIQRAYARKLRECRPDENPEGFQALVAARDRALNWRWPAKKEMAEASDSELSTTQEESRNSTTPAETPEARREEKVVAGHSVLRAINQFRPAESEPDPLAVEQKKAFAESVAKLRKLVGTGPNNEQASPDIFSDIPAWRDMLGELGELTIAQRRAFRDLVIRETLPRLPEPPTNRNFRETVRKHRGPLTVIGLIEDEFSIGQDHSGLVRLCGEQIALRYLRSLDRANDLRTLEWRRSTGVSAYYDANGVAILPPQDRSAKIGRGEEEGFLDMGIKDYLASAQNTGRWPLYVMWWAALFPRVAFLLCGLPFLSLGYACGEAFAVAASIAAISSNEPSATTAQFWLVIIVALRGAVALLARRLAIQSAMTRIQTADRQWLIGKPRRDYIAPGRSWLGLRFRLAAIFEIFMLFGLFIAFALAIASHAHTPYVSSEDAQDRSLTAVAFLGLVVWRLADAVYPKFFLAMRERLRVVWPIATHRQSFLGLFYLGGRETS